MNTRTMSVTADRGADDRVLGCDDRSPEHDGHQRELRHDSHEHGRDQRIHEGDHDRSCRRCRA